MVERQEAADQWHEEDELKIYHEALEQIEFADKLGYDYVFITEHHFLEEYCHSSAPEVFLAAAAARTKHIRLGHGIVQMPPKQNHPARVAERIAALDLVSRGRVEFGVIRRVCRAHLRACCPWGGPGEPSPSGQPERRMVPAASRRPPAPK